MTPDRIWTFDELPKHARDEFPFGDDLVFVEVDAGTNADPPRAFVPFDPSDARRAPAW